MKRKDTWRSFLKGWDSVFLKPAEEIINPASIDGPRRDAQALRGDWVAIGKDISNSMATVVNGA